LFEKHIDSKKNKTLDHVIFEKLMRELAPGLKDEEIFMCFKKLDINSDLQISFE
jgi:Ca2+-binding EF-hand superfamily protein